MATTIAIGQIHIVAILSRVDLTVATRLDTLRWLIYTNPTRLNVAGFAATVLCFKVPIVTCLSKIQKTITTRTGAVACDKAIWTALGYTGTNPKVAAGGFCTVDQALSTITVDVTAVGHAAVDVTGRVSAVDVAGCCIGAIDIAAESIYATHTTGTGYVATIEVAITG